MESDRPFPASALDLFPLQYVNGPGESDQRYRLRYLTSKKAPFNEPEKPNKLYLTSNLPLPVNNKLCGCQLLQPHRPEGMKLGGVDPNFCTKA